MNLTPIGNFSDNDEIETQNLLEPGYYDMEQSRPRTSILSDYQQREQQNIRRSTIHISSDGRDSKYSGPRCYFNERSMSIEFEPPAAKHIQEDKNKTILICTLLILSAIGFVIVGYTIMVSFQESEITKSNGCFCQHGTCLPGKSYCSTCNDGFKLDAEDNCVAVVTTTVSEA